MTTMGRSRDASRRSGWPDPVTLIPHRPPFLLVEEIVDRPEGALVCRGRLPCLAPTGGPATTSPFLVVELAAQAAAVMAALDGAGSPAPEGTIGYLAAIHDARFPVAEIPGEGPLLATVRESGRIPPFARYTAEVIVERDAVTLLTATLSTVVGELPG